MDISSTCPISLAWAFARRQSSTTCIRRPVMPSGPGNVVLAASQGPTLARLGKPQQTQCSSLGGWSTCCSRIRQQRWSKSGPSPDKQSLRNKSGSWQPSWNLILCMRPKQLNRLWWGSKFFGDQIYKIGTRARTELRVARVSVDQKGKHELKRKVL